MLFTVSHQDVKKAQWNKQDAKLEELEARQIFGPSGFSSASQIASYCEVILPIIILPKKHGAAWNLYVT